MTKLIFSIEFCWCWSCCCCSCCDFIFQSIWVNSPLYFSLKNDTSTFSFTNYSQTWANNHLRRATTILWNFYYINDLWTTTTCQRPLFLGPEGGCCTQVWLYFQMYGLLWRKNVFIPTRDTTTTIGQSFVEYRSEDVIIKS